MATHFDRRFPPSRLAPYATAFLLGSVCFLGGRFPVLAQPADADVVASIVSTPATPTPAQYKHAIEVLRQIGYPSAVSCRPCHQQIYDEWRSSSHAYASVSPMFHKFEQKITELSQGTIGTFCLRCHSSVGTTLGEQRELALWDRYPISREGVTCVTCHRVDEEYGRVNGERHMIPGSIFDPVFGPTDAAGLRQVLGDKGLYKVRTNHEERGKDIHQGVFKMDQLSKSEFCVSCHQVAVHPGIKLEVVWEQYRDSPAFREGISCQDCHMGLVPGQAKGYAVGPAAVVDGQPVNPGRKRANHAFYGPGYSIAHPGIFPHHPDAGNYSMQAWLKFDYRAGWGTPEFEEKVLDGEVTVEFPEEWESEIDREEARAIVDDNLAKLKKKAELRRQVMEAGSQISGPFFRGEPTTGKPLRFHYQVMNTNPGHNLPSGSLGAQPEIWLNVALLDPDGRNIWESGYVDSHGDMADLHSHDVLAGTLKRDRQLFNLQSKFLTTNVKGTDREMYLPVNMDIDQIPFIRPSGLPVSVLNHPPFIRMEMRSIAPLGSRDAKYKVPAELIKKPGKYRLAVRLRSRAEPIYFMKFVGATREMEQAMNEWMIDIHPYTVEFEVK
jgi:hypothetical protein